MTAIFEAKLDVAVGSPDLDSFEAPDGAFPLDTFVVSRSRSGHPLSLYGHLVWDYGAYSPEGKPAKLFFTYWGAGQPTPSQLARSIETRRVIFAMIWKRDGPRLAPRTLINHLIVLNALAQHAEKHDLTVFNLLGDESTLCGFIKAGCGGWMAETLGTLLGNLAKISTEQLGFKVVGSKAIAEIQKQNKDYRASLKQHAPMPTRIYLHFIQALKSELLAWQAVSQPMLDAVTACGADPRMGRTEARQCNIEKKLKIDHLVLPAFEKLVDAKALEYITSRGKAPNVKSLSYVVAEVQVACKLLVQAFTGMRDDEAASLPYDCLETHTVNGRLHYLIKGRTTKLNHGRVKRTRWVTNRDGHMAIQLARAIADAVYAIYGITPGNSDKRTGSHPLFVSMGYANLASAPMKPIDGVFVPGTMSIRPESRLNETLCTTIENADLRELEHVDPFRAWRSEEKFKLQQRWSFTTHQLRRSLALYAQRSGLVSIPSLRRQLQHLTEDMSRYYARGSEFAKDFLGEDKEHFGHEWQATQAESAGLSYILNVLLTGDKLVGGHAHWVAHRAKGPDGTVLEDRQVTMKRFKKGEMAYRDTLIGGCTSVQECDKPALNLLDIECVRDGCKNLVCSLPKLERVINAQQRMVGELDPSSVEYRTERADLEVLVAARDEAFRL